MTASNSPRTRLALAAGAVAVVGVVGALLVTVHSSNRAETTVDAQPHEPAHSGGTDGVVEQIGLATGFSHDRDGASAAAVAYATAPQRWLYLTDQQITEAITAIATPDAAPRLTEDVVGDVRAARERLGETSGRVWWLVRPLAWHVDAQSTDRASVAVWVVTILSAEKVAAPQTDFATVTIDVAWVDNGWRVDEVREAPGPTPMTGLTDQPWDAGPFDQALAGFTRMDGEPVR